MEMTEDARLLLEQLAAVAGVHRDDLAVIMRWPGIADWITEHQSELEAAADGVVESLRMAASEESSMETRVAVVTTVMLDRIMRDPSRRVSILVMAVLAVDRLANGTTR